MSSDALRAVDAAIQAVGRLRQTLKKGSNRQVRAQDERDLVKAVALSWFNDQRKSLRGFDNGEYSTIDGLYQEMLHSCEASITRVRYLSELATLKQELVGLRARLVAGRLHTAAGSNGDDAPPDFSALVADEKMRTILARRWGETRICLGAGAHLAATVMMGGLLEALFLARLNKTQDKAPLFRASSAPKDHSTGKTAQLKDWTLRDFIDVGHEVGWIAHSAKDVSVVLRDWRNYIHPQKELSHDVDITARETAVLWTVFVAISRELLAGPG